MGAIGGGAANPADHGAAGRALPSTTTCRRCATSTPAPRRSREPPATG